MTLFETCLPKKTGTRIYLPEEDSEEESIGWFSCCLWRRQYKEGVIRLPEGSRRTIDDYLDPRSPVNIEVLLAEQEEELDHYLGQTDDEDGFVHRRKLSFVSNTFLEEDAQFLSEHRISAILVDRPKLGGANLFLQSENIESPPPNQQDFLDIVIPVTSTSTSSISNRVFAIKTEPEPKHVIADVMTLSPKEMNPIIPSPSSSTSTISSLVTTSSMENHYGPLVGSSNSLSVFPVASSSTRISEFPATTLTRTPYQPIPIMHHDIIPAIGPRTSSHPSVLSQPTPQQPTGRRPSVVAVAQSLLGDKLDDFTEKLAFIKKNIIMSMDSDEEEELTENNHFYNTNTLSHRKSLDGRDMSNVTNTTWDNFVLPKFKKQGNTPNNSNAFSQQKTHAVPLSVTQRRNSNASSFSDEDELFDFSTVGKNVRTFGEGVMGNGLRMFNNLSTRIKKHNDK